MRGFRGSRAAQNVMSSRYGHLNNHHQDQNGASQNGQSQGTPTSLPDWLKTPETRAREEQERQQQGRPQQQQRQQTVKQPQQPLLRSVPTPPMAVVPKALPNSERPIAERHGNSNSGATPVVARPQLKVLAGGKDSAKKPTRKAVGVSSRPASSKAATKKSSSTKAATAKKRTSSTGKTAVRRKIAA